MIKYKSLFKAVLFVSLLFLVDYAFAQCPNCKASVITNSEEDGGKLAQGLNYGIMYLFALPYILGFIVFISASSRKKGLMGKLSKFLRNSLGMAEQEV